MSPDDILYSPIVTEPTVDQGIIASLALALGDPHCALHFQVDSSVTLATYLRIADIIEADPIVFKAASNSVPNPFGSFRPAGALTIKALFESLHQDPKRSRFYWTNTGSLAGVELVDVANVFSIVGGLPMMRLADGRDYEWWFLGLMSKFAGYNGYYAFDVLNDARSYWIS